MDHALLTRFNLPTGGTEALIRANKEWLARRVDLFERYCLPSVRAQTCQHFGWLVYFDPESPSWLRERIDKWSADGLMRPVFRTHVTNSELLADIEALIGRTSSRLITSNIDNDDALAVDFVKRLQATPGSTGRCAVYLANGLVFRDDRIYAHRDSANAFHSVREEWNGARTCWTDWHNMLGQSMPVQVLDGPPAWLQVVHGANVSNRIRGRLVEPAPYRYLFPGLLDSVPKPTRGVFLHDELIGAPHRFLTERVRWAGKEAIMKASGRGGLNRARIALEKLRHRSVD